MAVIKQEVRTNEWFCKCDRCGKLEKSDKTLHDALELHVAKSWRPVKGISSGWLCPECYDTIITEWYTVHEPDMVRYELPLFQDPVKKDEGGLTSDEIAAIRSYFRTTERKDDSIQKLSKQEIDSILEDLEDNESNDDIPF